MYRILYSLNFMIKKKLSFLLSGCKENKILHIIAILYMVQGINLNYIRTNSFNQFKYNN